MEQILNKLDMEKTIGVVTLSDGVTKVGIPKLSMSKIIRIVKFLGVDGAKLYGECREILLDPKLDDIEKVSVIFETLKEEQLIRVFSIMLDLSDEDVLAFDPNEMLEILLVYADKTDLRKTFTLVRQLMKKMFNKELPDNLKEWFPRRKVAPTENGSKSST
ncbi:hypothetical protein COJ96_10935 [Bacillus sp. AFS073361]|uniref:hypothetical protein n=1 Tax=Bacillus sp. AFS073361 TaxID=2033511 RepID=UPI000BF3265D|nr:hypothetical protein [Bacillus sp. AFS073361]PFP29411.1 hypothetical protein COJ96_10935 [Bacillus sp. AFS073361]